MVKKIAVLGDFNPSHTTHHALNDSIRSVTKKIDEEIQFDWTGTDIIHYKTAFQNLYCGLWIAPGSPYNNMENVLNTIRYTRENNIPTLGNCGGFQHMIIEFARNVCGIEHADHEETNPDAKELLISKLSCSLRQQEEALSITDINSLLYSIVKRTDFIGRYNCSYGINHKYVDRLAANGLHFTAQSTGGQLRAFEITSHPFFIGTLFQPALTSAPDQPDPIILDFVRTSIGAKY